MRISEVAVNARHKEDTCWLEVAMYDMQAVQIREPVKNIRDLKEKSELQTTDGPEHSAYEGHSGCFGKLFQVFVEVSPLHPRRHKARHAIEKAHSIKWQYILVMKMGP